MVTVPAVYVVEVVVSVVVAGFVVVVSSVVVVLVCAKANGVTSAQMKPMIAFFTLIPPVYG
ncbi:MAG: hypothetical protein DMF28_01080 [Verrucomicrobia bacterium]|nr:MAG: hypothetical protein DMF28_01080 [Verrucomicrobiota bacterium]